MRMRHARLCIRAAPGPQAWATGTHTLILSGIPGELPDLATQPPAHQYRPCPSPCPTNHMTPA